MPYFDDPEPQCLENNSFNLTGEGITPQGTTFNWSFGPNASPSNDNIPNPTNITFDEVGIFPITYNLQYNDCDETYIGTIEVFDEELFPEIPNIESQCFLGNSFNLTAEGIYPANSNFLWEFGPNAGPRFRLLSAGLRIWGCRMSSEKQRPAMPECSQICHPCWPQNLKSTGP